EASGNLTRWLRLFRHRHYWFQLRYGQGVGSCPKERCSQGSAAPRVRTLALPFAPTRGGCPKKELTGDTFTRAEDGLRWQRNRQTVAECGGCLGGLSNQHCARSPMVRCDNGPEGIGL